MVSRRLTLNAILSDLVLWSHDPCIVDQELTWPAAWRTFWKDPRSNWRMRDLTVGCAVLISLAVLLGFVLVAGSENQVCRACLGNSLDKIPT